MTTKLVESHLRRIVKAEADRVKAEQQASDALTYRNALIAQAFDMGINRRLISEAAQVSRQGIYWIVDREPSTDMKEQM